LSLPPAPAVAAAAKVALPPLATKASVGSTINGRPKQEPAHHDQAQLPPKLALVSHELALAATLASQPVGSSSTGVPSAEAWQLLQSALARLDRVSAEATGEGGCMHTATFCSDGTGLGRRPCRAPCRGVVGCTPSSREALVWGTRLARGRAKAVSGEPGPAPTEKSGTHLVTTAWDKKRQARAFGSGGHRRPLVRWVFERQ
jgi:hypothetical protein